MKTDSKYAYPAIFSKEIDGHYSVIFPDIPRCFTRGENLVDALCMASYVLSWVINANYEEENIEVPELTPIEKIKLKEGEFASYVVCDTKQYRERLVVEDRIIGGGNI